MASKKIQANLLRSDLPLEKWVNCVKLQSRRKVIANYWLRIRQKKLIIWSVTKDPIKKEHGVKEKVTTGIKKGI